jgi:hypothetical protein
LGHDDATRPDEDVAPNYDMPDIASMGDDDGTQTNLSARLDGNALGIFVFNVDIVADEHVLADSDAAPPVEDRPNAGAAGGVSRKSTENAIQ